MFIVLTVTYLLNIKYYTNIIILYLCFIIIIVILVFISNSSFCTQNIFLLILFY